jgi:hypothetical protein
MIAMHCIRVRHVYLQHPCLFVVLQDGSLAPDLKRMHVSSPPSQVRV